MLRTTKITSKNCQANKFSKITVTLLFVHPRLRDVLFIPFFVFCAVILMFRVAIPTNFGKFHITQLL